MASAGLLALLDDIATVLDDIAVMTKVASKKTAGLLGDDLALNAEQVSGVRAERELPVVWAVAKGSALNKVILVPAALVLSAFFPWLITPLLMLGGSYLCYEGFEKVFHKFLVKDSDEEHKKTLQAIADPKVDMVAFEKKKIQGAIRTDFILSAEIVVIALGTVQDAPFIKQAMVVTVIAALMTVGVYALVAMIVKLDDAGLHLLELKGDDCWPQFKRAFGKLLLKSCPVIMKGLSVVGTLAMFLVGGGILIHGLPLATEIDHLLMSVFATLPMGSVLGILASISFAGVFGLLAGGVVVALVSGAVKSIDFFRRA